MAKYVKQEDTHLVQEIINDKEGLPLTPYMR